MPYAIRIISQPNQQRMTKTGALDFGVHYYNLVRAIFNSTRTRVTCEQITTQRLMTPEIATNLAVIGIFWWSENAGNKILRRIFNPDMERYDYKVCIQRRKRYVTMNFVGAWIFLYICVCVFNAEHLKHDKFGCDWNFLMI
jgi:hypothetical protein